MSVERWRRVRRIVEDAIERPEERAAILERACGGEPGLRAEVESLLAAHEDEGPLDRPAGLRASDLAAPSPLAAGARVGPYRVLRELGRGGMGAVYLAERADESFEQRVAVKVVDAPLQSEELLRRFLDEREILGRLDHPGIARIVDAGALPGGSPWFAMEYVEGLPLDEHCDRRRLFIAERIALFREVCETVSYAHRNLVVHRDLKPGNVLVTEEGRPKLLDFGIARLLAAGGQAPLRTLTRLGGRPLTPEYASPEAILGDPVTTASDVYSLGVVLYELLVGRRPLARAGDGLALLREAAQGERVPPPSDTVRGLDPTGADTARLLDARRLPSGAALERRLQGDLDRIVLKALHEDPSRRYESAAALSADLRRHLRGEPVEARGDSLSYRAAKFVRRHRWGVAAAAAVLAALLAGLAATAWQARVAAAERDRARREVARTAAVSAFLQDMLSSANPDWTQRGRRDVTVREVLDEAGRRLETELPEAPEIRAEVLRTLGRTYRGMGLYPEATEHLSAALALMERHEPGGRSGAETRYFLAQSLLAQGAFEPAERRLREAVAELRRGARAPDVFLLGATNDSGLLELVRGRPEAAEPLLQEALALGRELWPDGRHPALGVIHGNLCRAALLRGELERAESRCRRALAAFERQPEPPPLETSTVLAKLGEVLLARGEVAAAGPVVERSVALARSGLGPGHPYLVFPLLQEAELALARGRPGAAEAAAREALAIQEGSGHLGEAGRADVLAALGRALAAAGRGEEAGPVLREALALQERVYPPASSAAERTRAELRRVGGGRGAP